MAVRAERAKWITRLDPIKYDRDDDADQDQLEQMSLGGVLLTLTRINHENEFTICRRVAEHLLGNVYEPEDIAMD